MNDEYYKLSVEEVINKLNSNILGLTDDKVNERLQKYGYNKLKEVKKKGILIKLLEQFKNFMLIILIIAAVVSGIVSINQSEPLTDSIIILVVVILNAILGVVQESKAEKAIEALKNMSVPYIKAIRNGKTVNISVEEIVPGDIVLLEAGDYVPADIRIIESHSLRVEESALTGESEPIDKFHNIIDSTKDIPLAERINMLYTGSSIVYGRGQGIVVSTGMETELGKIATAIYETSDKITPLQKKMNELSKILSIIVIIIAVVMFFVGYLRGNPILDVFMLAVSLAVAAIPEGLAAVITITLAIGVSKMAKEKAIVRKLSAVETLGSTEIICSDKTGTLTQNRMTVRKVFIDNKLIDMTNEVNLSQIEEKLSINKVDKKLFEEFLKIMVLCNDSSVITEGEKEVLLGDPTETALIDFAKKYNISKLEYDETYERVEEMPFDSVRKMMSTINNTQSELIVCVKGAIESVISNCKYININGNILELTNEYKENILKNNLDLSNEALRVLGFAYKNIAKDDNTCKNIDLKTIETNLVFCGMIGMIDPPRPEAKQATKDCFDAGMIPVMITGDNINTAKAIATELGILQEGYEAITGNEIDKLTDEELYNRVEKIRVYARVTPENKIRIVKAWKSHGKIVAMTGDGVNDAPAIKGADIGIGMGITGTEVSKSVSSIVLADDNFSTIVVAVKEGRRIYNNIKNVIAYLLASNLAEILIIFIATLFNQTLLLPIQILWINLVTDTIPAIALGFEKEESDVMKQKPRNSKENFFTPYLSTRIIVPAVLKAIFIFICYFIISNKYDSQTATTFVFLTLSLVEIFFAYVSRTDKKPISEIGFFSNKPIILCILGAIILQALIISVPMLSEWLKITKLTTNLYILIFVISIIFVYFLGIVKIIIAKIFNKNNLKSN